MKVVLEKLTKRFASREEKGKDVVAVSNFSFEIPDGQLVGLLGPSGCGKSTTLNLISGLERPTEGRIYFGDQDVTDLPPEERGIGLVFQNYALYPHMTVEQNIIFPLQNVPKKNRMTKAQMHDKAMEAARLVQIDHLMNRKPKELSGGQQQRVAIARALVKIPRVLLLDEPLSNLDARLRLQTREELRRIQRETGVTTVFVTHDQEEAMSISDLIIVMKDGVVQQIGRPQDVYNNPVNLFVAQFIGTPAINVLRGSIRNGRVWIGSENVLDANGKPEGDVWVAIRPEGFVLNPQGVLTCRLEQVEVMGRDVSVVSHHEEMTGRNIRSIIPAEDADGVIGEIVRFDLKPAKVCLFDRESEERV